MRKLVTIAGVSALTVTLGAVAVDTGAAIYAEYQFSRHVRSAADLTFDPWVAILGFPFIPQVRAHRYSEMEIKAVGVPHPELGKATLEATMHDVGLDQASWLMRPDADLPMRMLESRIIMDSRHLGASIGITDLNVQAPTDETDDPTGGTTESGISGSEGLIFSGTPTEAGLDEVVSVTVDLSTTGPDQTTLVFTPTGVATGPNTADQPVPEDKQTAVLNAFRATIPGQRLPFGLRPTALGARGSDIIIEGIVNDVTVRLDEFRP